jgi:hypothetical protein
MKEAGGHPGLLFGDPFADQDMDHVFHRAADGKPCPRI